ncbi:hypothetical protein D3C83_09280 [compost metagenome]
MHPLQVRRRNHRFPVGGIELFGKADVAVQKNARDALALRLRQTSAVLFRQHHEGDGLAGARRDGREGFAKAGDELFRNQCANHDVWRSRNRFQ